MEQVMEQALLDLRVALGELQATLINIDKAVTKLMALMVDKKCQTDSK